MPTKSKKTALDYIERLLNSRPTQPQLLDLLLDPNLTKYLQKNQDEFVRVMCVNMEKKKHVLAQKMLSALTDIPPKSSRALRAAVLSHNLDLVKKAQKWCGHLDTDDVAVEYAVTTEQMDVLKHLLSKKPSIKKKQKKISHMALAHASARGDVAYVDLLLDWCDVNDLGALALQWSIKKNHIEVAKKMISDIDLDQVHASMKKKNMFKDKDYTDFLQTLKAFAIKEHLELALESHTTSENSARKRKM